jgi:hypothetical protein
VTAAVGLIVLAALVVSGAALSGSWLLVTVAAGLGVVLGAAATRITHTELVESRVEAARDRAVQAAAYNELTEERTTEHASFVADVRTKLSAKERALEELEQEVLALRAELDTVTAAWHAAENLRRHA